MRWFNSLSGVKRPGTFRYIARIFLTTQAHVLYSTLDMLTNVHDLFQFIMQWGNNISNRISMEINLVWTAFVQSCPKKTSYNDAVYFLFVLQARIPIDFNNTFCKTDKNACVMYLVNNKCCFTLPYYGVSYISYHIFLQL